MSYQVKIEKFQGPFDLLLQLIKKEKLDVTELSLAQVTDEFLIYINQAKEIEPEELANFLEIATKLLLIKSRFLIPVALEEEEEEEELVEQLKIYQQYAQATKEIEKIASQSRQAFSRDKIFFDQQCHFSQDLKITKEVLRKYFKDFVDFLSDQVKIDQKTIKRKIVSLKSKIKELLDNLKIEKEVNFNNLIEKKEHSEKIVLFQAALELMRRHQIVIYQKGLWQNIIVSKRKIKEK